MKFVYFTKLLQPLDLKGYITFFKDAGLDGADLAIRPGYPVHPDNIRKALPEAVRQFKDAGLIIGIATAPTNLIDPESKLARDFFEACAEAGVPAVKIGYFSYRGGFEEALQSARKTLAGFAKLAQRTGVKACYHTHSGNYLGGNAASLRMLLTDLDPHHVGAFLDTGHTAVDGGPIRLEVDTVRPWLSLFAIKDMLYSKQGNSWKSEVVPVGQGIVNWKDFGQAIRESKFNGTISLHGEYEAKDLAERTHLARLELSALKDAIGK